MDNLKRGLLGLAVRRKAAGYTQETFAAALGVTRPALAQWETGGSWPSAAILPQIADLLLCSIDDLYKLPPETEDEEPEAAAGPSIVKLYGGGFAIEEFTTEGRP